MIRISIRMHSKNTQINARARRLQYRNAIIITRELNITYIIKRIGSNLIYIYSTAVEYLSN